MRCLPQRSTGASNQNAATITGGLTRQYDFHLPRAILQTPAQVRAQHTSGFARIPDGIKVLGTNTYQDYKTSLIRVVLPRSLVEIQERSFEGFVSLKTVEVSTSLGKQEQPSHDISDISLKVIGRYAFAGCIALISFEFASTLQTIEDGAFESCTSLQEAKLPKTLLRIGAQAFFNCINLRLVELNDGLRVIDKGAFHSCRALECVRLPPTIKRIEQSAFGNCKKLLSVEFPETAQCCLMRSDVFAGCEKLLNCYLPLKKPQAIAFEEKDMMFRFGGPEYSNLQRRFDHLPVHKLCYTQWNHATEFVRQQLDVIIQDKDVYESGYRADCFFLTPFHILALSTKLNTELFHFLFKKHPGVNLNDKNILGMSPMSIILERVRMGSLNVEALRIVVAMQLRSRVKALMVDEEWEAEFKASIESLGGCDPKRDVNLVYQKLESKEKEEAMTILELGVWKAKLKQTMVGQNKFGIKRKRKFHEAFQDNTEHNNAVRSVCRSQCGSDFVIPLVLSYLIPEGSESGIFSIPSSYSKLS